jgi:hypothetical protein
VSRTRRQHSLEEVYRLFESDPTRHPVAQHQRQGVRPPRGGLYRLLESDPTRHPAAQHQRQEPSSPLPTEERDAEITPDLLLPESSTTWYAPIKSTVSEPFIASSAIAVRSEPLYLPKRPSIVLPENESAPASPKTTPAVPRLTPSKSQQSPEPECPSVPVNKNKDVELLEVEQHGGNQAYASPSHPVWIQDIVKNVQKHKIHLSSQDDTSLCNRAMTYIERCSEYTWDWWPLQPCRPNLPPGKWRLQWEVSLRGASWGIALY